MPKQFTVKTQDGIEWYCEQQGSGPNLILIPSGEGDCFSFSKIASILSVSFTVTTFDMPGFSRTVAPESMWENFKSLRLLSKQIVGLMDELSIESAHFYGCSSGGAAVLGLVADHPTRVTSGIVHEVPVGEYKDVKALLKLDDDGIRDACRGLFRTVMCEDQAAWEALGPDYHARVDKNYVTWVKRYVGGLESPSWSEKELQRKPVRWTIGALNPAGMFFDNVPIAVKAGIPIDLLSCKHFPQVTIPENLAEHIKESALRMAGA